MMQKYIKHLLSFYSNFKYPGLPENGKKKHIRLKSSVIFSYQFKQFENEFAICKHFSLKMTKENIFQLHVFIYIIFIFQEILIKLWAMVGQQSSCQAFAATVSEELKVTWMPRFSWGYPAVSSLGLALTYFSEFSFLFKRLWYSNKCHIFYENYEIFISAPL